MLVLKILAIIIILFGILLSLYFFNEHCGEKFNYRFFTTRSLLTSALALAFILIGNWWHSNSLESGGDTLNGIAMMSIGAFLALILIYFNFKHTNFAYGFGGTFLQLSAFGLLIYLGTFILILGLVIFFIISLGTPIVQVID